MKTYRIFAPYSDLVAGVSDASDGDLRWANGELPKTQANRRQFLAGLGVRPDRVVGADIVHGNRVAFVGRPHGGTYVEDTDGLVTADLGAYLAITVGDCQSIMAVDPTRRRVGLGHAGREGLRAGIATALISSMVQHGARAEDILVAVGPTICAAHYPVTRAQAEEFRERWPGTVADKPKPDGRVCLDLRRVCARQLRDAGVLPEHIEFDVRCTFEDPELYSSRRGQSERLAAIIGFRSPADAPTTP